MFLKLEICICIGNTKKSQEFGWKPKMNSADSIKKAIQEIIKEVQ